MNDIITPPPAPPPAPPPTDWTTGLEAEVVGHWQTKGLIGPGKTVEPKDVAVAITKQYRELEKFNGVPADQIARIPKADAPEAEVKAFWAKLGADADPKQYDFANIKNSDGTAADPALLDTIRNAAAGALIPKTAAAKLAADIVKHVEAQTTEKAAQAGHQLGCQHDRGQGRRRQARRHPGRGGCAREGGRLREDHGGVPSRRRAVW
jgi:hypothetical protein